MADATGSKGWQGTVLKIFRAGDFKFTVTGKEQVGPHYVRVSFEAGGMLTGTSVHPTQWVRMWFSDGDKLHQRGYTLVNPDTEADTVDVEFALHDGIASQWATDSEVGDTIEVTVLGSSFALPQPQPSGYLIVGDTASLPAINSLLSEIGDVPAWVFLEAAHDDDRELPVARASDAGIEVLWIDRENGGQGLVDAVAESAFDASDHFAWVACDNRTTRGVAKVLREDYHVPRKSIKAQGYWVA